MYEMPAAITNSSVDAERSIAKFTAMNRNFSTPSSPQRSSSSSLNTDSGSSAFLAMAKRLHRLRLAAASPNLSIDLESTVPKQEEFISIRPLSANARPAATVEETVHSQMPQLSSTNADQSMVPIIEQPPSQPESIGTSFSDISIASYYRLPPPQAQTSSNAFVPRISSAAPTMVGSRVWSSEPVLAADGRPTTSANASAIGRSKNGGGPSVLESGIDQQILANRISSLQLQDDNRFSNITTVSEAFQANESNGGRVPDSQIIASTSSHYSELTRGSLHVARPQPESFHHRTNGDGGYPAWIRTQPIHDHHSSPTAAALPPLPDGRTRPKTSHPTAVNSELPSTSNANNHGHNHPNHEQAPYPGSISRLMDAVSKHPVGSLDFTKLKSILREQRKQYKRRLEREKAKREALEDLLVKLNSTPRMQRRSFSNSSSNVSTVRNANTRRQAPGENGRSSVDLNEVVINSLRSSSIDGSSTNSEDVFLLELIQQHLRMKQALVGHLGKRNGTASSSISGGEHDQQEPNVNGVVNANGMDDDEIPMGGEASGPPITNSASARVISNGHLQRQDDSRLRVLRTSKSADYDEGGPQNGMNGHVDKNALKLMLDNSSNGSSVNGHRSESAERRKQRRKWDTNSSAGISVKETDRDGGGLSGRLGSGRSQMRTQRPSVAFFVSADAQNDATSHQNGLIEMKDAKPLQNAFREHRAELIQRSLLRQDKIKAASSLRSEAARRLRELADNVAKGHIRLDEANETLLAYELPQPCAFSRLEMFRASKKKFDQLPETIAKKNKLKRECELATNRVLAKMFKQKMAYKRLLKKAEKRGSTHGVLLSQDLASSNGRQQRVDLLNR